MAQPRSKLETRSDRAADDGLKVLSRRHQDASEALPEIIIAITAGNAKIAVS
jgi:hypothetical protein